MRRLLYLIFSLLAIFCNAQCPLDFLSKDIEKIESFVDEKGMDAWYALYKSDETDVVRQDVANLDFVDEYIKSSGKESEAVGEEIKNFGGFLKWKSINLADNSITSFKKLDKNVSSTLDNKIFNELTTQLENQSFIRFDNSQHLIQNPKSFLNDKGDTFYEFVLDDLFYIKYDLSDGRILMADAKDGTYYAFAQNKFPLIIKNGENADEVIRSHLIAQTDKLKSILGLTGNRAVKVLGENIIPAQNKVSTFIGRLNVSTYNINQLKKEFGDFKNIDLGEGILGSANILNRPDTYWVDFNSWLINHNIPWMKRAFNRSDDFYIASEVWDIEVVAPFGTEGFRRLTITAYELKYLEIKNIRPKNLSENQWNEVKLILARLNFDKNILKIMK